MLHEKSNNNNLILLLLLLLKFSQTLDSLTSFFWTEGVPIYFSNNIIYLLMLYLDLFGSYL